MVVLGDNIIENNISQDVNDFNSQKNGAYIFLKSVKNPQAYGVAEIENGQIVSITEKPKDPKSDLAVTGVYMYDAKVFDIVKTLKPSHRGELEITDVNNFYLNQGTLKYSVLDGFWGDCGESFDSLMEASTMVQGSALACIDENLTILNREHRKISDKVVSDKKYVAGEI